MPRGAGALWRGLGWAWAVLLVGLLVSSVSWAASGTVELSAGAWGGAQSGTVASNSCADVLVFVNASSVATWAGQPFTGCSSDPVVVGTTFTPWPWDWVTPAAVVSITATAGATGGDLWDAQASMQLLPFIGMFVAFALGVQAGLTR